MNEQLRSRIYEILGLNKGDLKSESGRDWNEALKQAEDELKQEIFIKKSDSPDKYNKDDIITSFDCKTFHLKIKIVETEILTDKECKDIIKCNDKDVHISLLRNQKLNKENIEFLYSIGVSFIKKYIKDNNLL